MLSLFVCLWFDRCFVSFLPTRHASLFFSVLEPLSHEKMGFLLFLLTLAGFLLVALASPVSFKKNAHYRLTNKLLEKWTDGEVEREGKYLGERHAEPDQIRMLPYDLYDINQMVKPDKIKDDAYETDLYRIGLLRSFYDDRFLSANIQGKGVTMMKWTNTSEDKTRKWRLVSTKNREYVKLENFALPGMCLDTHRGGENRPFISRCVDRDTQLWKFADLVLERETAA